MNRIAFVSTLVLLHLAAVLAAGSIDWRNFNGLNYATVSRNQHLPSYCQSSWAFSVTAMVGSRIKIARGNSWPEIDLSPQVLLNCASAAGSCDGGNPELALEYVKSIGLPDETCMPYEAVANNCSAENVCMNCGYDLTDPTALCTAVNDPKLYVISSYAFLNGTQAMQAEISKNGPIVCGVAVTDALLNYNGGILADNSSDILSHWVVVAGYGTLGSQNFWVVQNSWGTAWGEMGWAQVLLGQNTLGIESECYAAVPSPTNPDPRIF